MQDLIHGMKRYGRFYIQPCGSQYYVDFQGLSMHTYIPMQDTSFTAVKSEKNIVQIMCPLNMVYTSIYQYIPVHTSMTKYVASQPMF